MTPPSPSDPPPLPGKPGCRRWACFGRLGLVLLSALIALALFIMFSPLVDSEDADSFGVESLPPATLWVMEARDLRGLLRQVRKNPASLELLAGLLDHFGDPLIPPGIREKYPGWRLRDLLNLPDFLLAVLFPNQVMIGASQALAAPDVSGADPASALFMICRLPRLGRWLLGISAADAPDGWLTFGSPLRSANGEARAPAKTPLAPLPFLGPGVQLAWRFPVGRKEAGPGPPAETPAAGPPGLFNPFDPASGGSEAPEDAAALPLDPGGPEDYEGRLFISPRAAGWTAEGNFQAAAGEASLPRPIEAKAIRLARGRRDGDIAVRIKIAPERLESWLEVGRDRLARLWPGWLPGNPVAPLFSAWLANASGDFYLAARPPAAPAVAAVPPLPVFSLGWRWRPGTDGRAADAFDSALAEWFAGLTGPGAPNPIPLIRNSLAYESRVEGGARRGRLTLPAVAVNSIRPAWRLPLAEGQV
ncbi:MAG: hypothetical protein LBU23_07455, partial [Planctomycetota bacterium]|nr:hypothetical protein [Planctomycetota bacterium]